jgi:hypothetical protein
LIRPELQVDTEQRKNFESMGMGFLHMEQTANGADMVAAYRPRVREFKRLDDPLPSEAHARAPWAVNDRLIIR